MHSDKQNIQRTTKKSKFFSLQIFKQKSSSPSPIEIRSMRVRTRHLYLLILIYDCVPITQRTEAKNFCYAFRFRFCFVFFEICWLFSIRFVRLLVFSFTFFLDFRERTTQAHVYSLSLSLLVRCMYIDFFKSYLKWLFVIYLYFKFCVYFLFSV